MESRTKLLLLVGLLLAGLVVWKLFIAGYGEISPKTYELANALYAICNQGDEERLGRFESLVEKSLESEEISHREAGWLNQIVETARSGDWETASTSCREMIADQVAEAP